MCRPSLNRCKTSSRCASVVNLPIRRTHSIESSIERTKNFADSWAIPSGRPCADVEWGLCGRKSLERSCHEHRRKRVQRASHRFRFGGQIPTPRVSGRLIRQTFCFARPPRCEPIQYGQSDSANPKRFVPTPYAVVGLGAAMRPPGIVSSTLRNSAGPFVMNVRPACNPFNQLS